MARAFKNQTDARLEVVSNVLGSTTYAFPFTFACWCYLPTLVDTNIVSIGSSSANNFHTLNYDGTNGVFTSQGTGSVTATGPASVVKANQWFHFAGVRSSATSAICYLNGVAGTTASGNMGTTSALDRTNIGVATLTGAPTTKAVGTTVAQVGIWNTALSGANITSLATMGTEVDSVASASLVGCWKLRGVDPIPGLGQFTAAGNDGPAFGTAKYELMGTAGATQVAQSIRWWAGSSLSAAHAILGVYGDNGSGTDPQTLLSTTASYATGAVPGEFIYLLNTPITITSGVKYWVGALQPSSDAAGSIKWGVAGAGTVAFDLSGATNLNALPAPADVAGTGGTVAQASMQLMPGEPDVGSGGNPMGIGTSDVTLDPWWQPDANAGQHTGERRTPDHLQRLAWRHSRKPT